MALAACHLHLHLPTISQALGTPAAATAASAAAASVEGEEDDGGEGGVRLALVAEVDAEAGVCHIQGAKVNNQIQREEDWFW
jgi:hypothetical protein